jgi:hypothetical protein
MASNLRGTNSAGFETDIKKDTPIKTKKYRRGGSETNIALRTRVKLEMKETGTKGILRMAVKCECQQIKRDLIPEYRNGI